MCINNLVHLLDGQFGLYEWGIKWAHTFFNEVNTPIILISYLSSCSHTTLWLNYRRLFFLVPFLLYILNIFHMNLIHHSIILLYFLCCVILMSILTWLHLVVELRFQMSKPWAQVSNSSTFYGAVYKLKPRINHKGKSLSYTS